VKKIEKKHFESGRNAVFLPPANPEYFGVCGKVPDNFFKEILVRNNVVVEKKDVFSRRVSDGEIFRCAQPRYFGGVKVLHIHAFGQIDSLHAIFFRRLIDDNQLVGQKRLYRESLAKSQQIFFAVFGRNHRRKPIGFIFRKHFLFPPLFPSSPVSYSDVDGVRTSPVL